MTKLFPRMVILCLLATASVSVQAIESVTLSNYTYPPLFNLNVVENWLAENHHPHLFSLAIGPTFSQDVGKSQTFSAVDPATDSFYQYHASHPAITNGQFALFIGDRWNLPAGLQLVSGIAYSLTGAMLTRGDLSQGVDVFSQDDYRYHYKLQSQQMQARVKFIFAQMSPISPYGEIGFGFARNRASDFNTDVPFALSHTRHFSSHTNYAFSYTLGTGFEYKIDPHTTIGLGYEFSDHGKTKFGEASVAGTAVKGTLQQSHLYTHALMAQVIYSLDNAGEV